MITSEQIKKLCARKGVKVIAVQNFLHSLYGKQSDCYSNLEMDASLYKWNAATQKAIRDGITLHFA